MAYNQELFLPPLFFHCIGLYLIPNQTIRPPRSILSGRSSPESHEAAIAQILFQLRSNFHGRCQSLNLEPSASQAYTPLPLTSFPGRLWDSLALLHGKAKNLNLGLKSTTGLKGQLIAEMPRPVRARSMWKQLIKFLPYSLNSIQVQISGNRPGRVCMRATGLYSTQSVH